VTEVELAEMIHDADINGDNVIDYTGERESPLFEVLNHTDKICPFAPLARIREGLYTCLARIYILITTDSIVA
jgi:hypothetical protein